MSSAESWSTACLRKSNIFGGFDERSFVKMTMVAVESVIITSCVLGGHDFVAHSNAMVAIVASRKLISRAECGLAFNRC